MVQIQFRLGDITKFHGDAIVNAANQSLMGGGGVDGAIHQAAGPELNNECARLNGCLPGAVQVTAGYRLPVRYIIHTVGPIWHAQPQDAHILKACYENALAKAVQLGCHTLAFPSISTGAYGYPLAQAASIAIQVLKNSTAPLRVTMVCFDANTLTEYQRAFNHFDGASAGAF